MPQLIDLSDEELVAQVVSRDVAAFTVLYDRYSEAIYALAVHATGVAEAEEILQDVFMRLWNAAHQYEARRGSVAGWLMTIARNRIRDAFRRHKQQYRMVVLEEIEHLLGTDDSIEDDVWKRQRGDALRAALKALPEEQRRVLLLAYFEDLSQSSISQRLGIPLGTVKKRIKLGMKKLRDLLNPEKDDVAQEAVELARSGDHEL